MGSVGLELLTSAESQPGLSLHVPFFFIFVFQFLLNSKENFILFMSVIFLTLKDKIDKKNCLLLQYYVSGRHFPH